MHLFTDSFLVESVTRRLLVCGVVLGFFAQPVAALEPGSEWPQFRGPGGQGHAAVETAPLEWSETKNVAWKTPLPGRGWSSPVISGHHIWLTAAEESPLTEEEKAKRLADNTGSQPLLVSGPVTMYALCVDLRDGKLLHRIELMTEDTPDPIHELNSFASPTPVLENGRLYCHFGTNGTACIDTKEGKVLWRNRELRLKHENGPGSTPIVWGDSLLFHCDGSDVQYLAALNKNTGKVAWRTDRSGKMHDHPQMKKAYGTPLVVEIGERPQVVSPAADWLYGYDPRTGKELWKLPYGELGFSIVPRPITGHGMVYICTSFMQSRLIAVRYDDGAPRIEWKYTRQVSQMPSPIIVGEELYFVSDKGGIVTCLNAKTGKQVWRKRIGGNYSSSPIYAAGRLYFSNREGTTTVLKPGKKDVVLATNTLPDGILASPAAVGKALYVRTTSALYRIEDSGTGDSNAGD